MALDPNEIVANPAAQRLNMPVDVEVEPARVRMGAFVEGGERPPAAPPPVRGHNGGNLGLLAVLLAALAAAFAGIAAFKPAGVSQPALESAVTDIKSANTALAVDLGQKLADGIVAATKARHDELASGLTTLANGVQTAAQATHTQIEALHAEVGKVASGQQDQVKATKRLIWRVLQMESSVKAASASAPAADRSFTVTADGSHHTIKIREY